MSLLHSAQVCPDASRIRVPSSVARTTNPGVRRGEAPHPFLRIPPLKTHLPSCSPPPPPARLPPPVLTPVPRLSMPPSHVHRIQPAPRPPHSACHFGSLASGSVMYKSHRPCAGSHRSAWTGRTGLLPQGLCCRRIPPITCTPITPSVYLPDPPPRAAHLTFRGLGTAGSGCRWWRVRISPAPAPRPLCGDRLAPRWQPGVRSLWMAHTAPLLKHVLLLVASPSPSPKSMRRPLTSPPSSPSVHCCH